MQKVGKTDILPTQFQIQSGVCFLLLLEKEVVRDRIYEISAQEFFFKFFLWNLKPYQLSHFDKKLVQGDPIFSFGEERKRHGDK